MASSKLLFCMSGLDLPASAREALASQDDLAGCIDSLTDECARKLLLNAALKHPDVRAQVLNNRLHLQQQQQQQQQDQETKEARPQPQQQVAKEARPLPQQQRAEARLLFQQHHRALQQQQQQQQQHTPPSSPPLEPAHYVAANFRRHSMPAAPVSPATGTGMRIGGRGGGGGGLFGAAASAAIPARRSVDISAGGDTVNIDYFTQRAREAVALPSGRRQDALLSLCQEVRVMIDLGHGDFALHAILSLLPVVGDRDGLDATAWREVTSFDGVMLKLSHLLQRAIACCPADRCREFLGPLASECRRLEGYGVSVLTPVYAALRKKCQCVGPARG